MAAVTSPLQSLITQFQTKEAEARAANIKRREQVTSIFDEIIARYGPEGTYGKGAEALLERQKVRDVGATAQRDIGRGLYGIRPYEQEWEAGVGAEARLRLEDIKMERLSTAQMGKAGFMERIEEPYPDLSALMQAVSAQAGAGGMPGYAAPRQPSAPPGEHPYMGTLGGASLTQVSPPPGRGLGPTPGAGLGDEPWGMPGLGGAVMPGPEAAVAGAPTAGVPTAPTQRKAPQTASLISRYSRYKKQLQRQGIGAGSIASYDIWYRANVGTGAEQYLSRKQPTGTYPGSAYMGTR